MFKNGFKRTFVRLINSTNNFIATHIGIVSMLKKEKKPRRFNTINNMQMPNATSVSIPERIILYLLIG